MCCVLFGNVHNDNSTNLLLVKGLNYSDSDGELFFLKHLSEIIFNCLSFEEFLSLVFEEKGDWDWDWNWDVDI
jgi:hypothetical protein